MRRIVVSLLKGGVAKSETAVSLAHGLALKGCRVLLVDTDVQAQCNDMLGVEPEQGLAEVIAGWAEPMEALVEARENLFLLAGGVPLAGVKMEIARREMAPEAVLDETLAAYEDHFDVMVMDTAPGWDTLLVNALYCAREVISPVSMEPVALKGLRRFEERLAVIQKYNPALALKWIVPTFVDGRVKKTAHIMEQLEAEFGDRLTAPIRYSVKLSEAPEFGLTIYEHDPRGAGAKGYRALVERVLAEAPAGEQMVFAPRPELPKAAPPVVREPPKAPPEPAPVEAPVAQEPVMAPPEPAPQEAPLVMESWEEQDGPLVDMPSWMAREAAPEGEGLAIELLETPEDQASMAPASAAETSAPPPRDAGASAASTPPPEVPPDATLAALAERLLQKKLAAQGVEMPPPVVEEEPPKVWDLRERLKKVPVLSQRLKRGLGSGS